MQDVIRSPLYFHMPRQLSCVLVALQFYVSPQEEKPDSQKVIVGGGKGRGGTLQYYVSPQEEKPDSQKVIVGVEG